MNAGEQGTQYGENGQMHVDEAIRQSGQVPDRFQHGESATDEADQIQFGRDTVPDPAQAGPGGQDDYGPGGDSGYQPDQYGSVREDAERKIDAAVDDYADKLPGGRVVADQAKQQISDVLDQFETQAADTLGDQNGL